MTLAAFCLHSAVCRRACVHILPASHQFWTQKRASSNFTHIKPAFLLWGWRVLVSCLCERSFKDFVLKWGCEGGKKNKQRREVEIRDISILSTLLLIFCRLASGHSINSIEEMAARRLCWKMYFHGDSFHCTLWLEALYEGIVDDVRLKYVLLPVQLQQKKEACFTQARYSAEALSPF